MIISIILIIVILAIVIGAVFLFKSNKISDKISNEELSSGTYESLKEKQEVKFEIEDEEHKMIVDSVYSDSVDIIIQSEPIEVNLKIGETKKFDLDGDGKYDLEVKLKNIVNGIPNIFIKKISEAVCDEDWNCESWSSCNEQGSQTRVCTDLNSCGTEEDKPEVIRACEVCVENWGCSGWSNCINGKKTRDCDDSNDCGTTNNKPDEERDCEVEINLANFDEEWGILQELIIASKDKDLNEVNSLVYTSISQNEINQCLDSDLISDDDCWNMVGGFAEDFNNNDFSILRKDTKQTIITMQFIEETEGDYTSYSRSEIYFVRNSSNKIKVLSIVFSFGVGGISMDVSLLGDTDRDGLIDKEEKCLDPFGEPYQSHIGCVETNYNNKDTDSDSWWDGIEDKAETDPNDNGDYLFK